MAKDNDATMKIDNNIIVGKRVDAVIAYRSLYQIYLLTKNRACKWADPASTV